MRTFPPHVVRTKIIPPPRRPRTLARPRVSRSLRQALEYRLTILQAGAGYGKSTALAELAAELAAEAQPLIWYQVSDEDGDPLVLLLHICYAVEQALPDVTGLPIVAIEAWDGDQGPLPWAGLLDQVINALSRALTAPALLVLDDAHQVIGSGDIPRLLDRLITLAPAHLHILLAGRPTLSLPSLPRWRGQGDLLLLDQGTLAFTLEEIAALFAEHYQVTLTAAEAQSLLAYTEGWAIALQLIWQHLRTQTPDAREIPGRRQAASLDTLFDLLAQEVFGGLTPDVQQFLLITATLRELLPDACTALVAEEMAGGTSGRTSSGLLEVRRTVGANREDRSLTLPALMGGGDTGAMLTYLRRQDLFVAETAEGVLRYHHIFHSFLRRQSTPDQQQQRHAAAAAYFAGRGDQDAALYHLLEAQDWEAAAELLDAYAADLLAAGRLETLAAYIDALPPQILHQHPGILFMLGELARLHSRFSEALGWYKQAEAVWRSRGRQDGIARALRGQARVYLDTVDPREAEQLLQEAIRLSDGFEDRAAQIRVFELLAENKLNAGRVEEAEQLRRRAESLRLEGPANDQLWFRVLLRTGRLHEARQALEERAAAERKTPVQTPRAHRETLLLLSLIYSLQGEAEIAHQAARAGAERGEVLNSPFVSAVGAMRQGHALQLLGGYRERSEQYARARRQYEKTIESSQQLAVPRLRVEAGWGLCRSYGYAGDIASAQSHAEEAIDLAVQAGDEWMASLVRLALGASLVLAGRCEAAEPWLGRAVLGFQECSDSFGRTAARLWLALNCFKQKQMERLAQLLPDVLAACRANDYAALWLRPSLAGAPDERVFAPLMLHAAACGFERAYVTQLLEGLNLSCIQLHPGYQLRVQTLGGFEVWRGDAAIGAGGWRRKSARQLFQLLLTNRRAPLDRDQICEALWPEADPVTAQQNFKIALNALYGVLEPARESGAESAYIVREGSSYALRPHADLQLDADLFVEAVRAARGQPDALQAAAQQAALALYVGEYLPDARYETWAAGERERLAAVFLQSADALAERLIADARPAEAIDLCRRILDQDNCWERAYRHLMLAYHGLGDRGQVARTYARCVQVLRAELDVEPTPETQTLYARLTG
jgi:DNA-binding SARP family transcriptional activator